jgi:hypothetical protein
MRDHLAHRYFDTAHAILQATVDVDEDLPDLEHAVQALARSLEESHPGPQPGRPNAAPRNLRRLTCT